MSIANPGDGIYCFDSTLTISNSAVSGNSAGEGGGGGDDKLDGGAGNNDTLNGKSGTDSCVNGVNNSNCESRCYNRLSGNNGLL